MQDLSNDNINIVIIDDGVNEKLYGIGPLNYNIQILPDLTVIDRKDYDGLAPSHGTLCAGIIRKYDGNAAIGSIKILNDDTQKGVKQQLIRALHWCAEHDLRLVNLSLGTIDFRDFEEIKECVNEVADKGLIIVAACNNKNVYTVPACLTNAIGVVCKKIYTDAQYKFLPYSFDGIDIAASGRHFLSDAFGKGSYTDPSNSFAAPLITAMAYKIIKKIPGISLESIRKELYKEALNFIDDNYNPYLCMSTDWRVKGRENGKIWDAGIYKLRLQERVPAKPVNIDIPVIAIIDAESGCILNRLDFLFKKEGYYSVRITTDCTDVTGGIEYLPEGMNAVNLTAMVYRKYCCDVILIRLNSEEFFENIETIALFEIILSVDGNENFFNFVNGQDSRPVCFNINRGSTDEDIKDIFDKVLEFFEDA